LIIKEGVSLGLLLILRQIVTIIGGLLLNESIDTDLDKYLKKLKRNIPR